MSSTNVSNWIVSSSRSVLSCHLTKASLVTEGMSIVKENESFHEEHQEIRTHQDLRNNHGLAERFKKDVNGAGNNGDERQL